MSEQPGFLLVTMQPPAGMEDEFHDWYDTEHMPERRAIRGFLTAQRFVCIEGWPRYVAMYDLAHPGVLAEAGYLAISGPNFTPWTKRILPRMQGLYRAAGVQVSAAPALLGERGACEWLALLKFRGVPASRGPALAALLTQVYGDDPAFVSARLFSTDYNGGEEFLATIEMRRPIPAAQMRVHELAPYDASLDLLNIYVRYWRHGRLHGVLSD